MGPETYARVCELFHELCELERSEQERRLRELMLSAEVRAEIESLLAFERHGRSVVELDAGRIGGELLAAQAESPQRGDLPASIGAYRVLEKIGEGGMGVVYAACHEDSQGVCAVKVVRPDFASREVVRRFTREARVLRELRHPGLAAFYDAGEAEARFPTGSLDVPYLAMEYVKGEELRRHVDAQGLDRGACLELLARVCDALQHAHEHGVVHRDLKPSNLLVAPGREDAVGQPKVLDFGIASTAGSDPRSGTLTRTGSLMGTLPYMSPEQIADGSRVDARSDLYSAGVIAFELLTGAMPCDLRGASLPEAMRRIRESEPSWEGLVSGPDHRGLRLVLGKALEKAPGRRYASAAEMAADLRALAAGSSILARGPGPLRRTAKTVRRRPLASVVVALGLFTFVSISILWRRAVVDRAMAAESREAALASSRLADERTRVLERERDYVLRLSDLAELHELIALEGQLWPAHPDQLDALDDWLARAAVLAGHAADGRAFLAELDAPQSAATFDLGAFEFEWWRETLRELVDGAEGFFTPETGVHARVRRRRERAASLVERTVEAHRERWDQAIEAIGASPRYGGLELAPQLGLVPLGADPASGLWEFWHVDTGAEPPRDPESGAVVMTEEGGLVFVLLAGGESLIGATPDDSSPHHDVWAKPRSSPVHRVRLSPFFVSKFEMTQGQWLRTTGTNPSWRPAGTEYMGTTYDLSFPQGAVTWTEATRALARLGLDLPTEAQWEHAARGGTATPRYVAGDPSALSQYENVADADALERFPDGKWFHYEAWTDGYVLDAPVGSYAPNPFSLHDVLGNLHEWCRDVYDVEFYARSPVVDPLRSIERDPEPGDALRTVRGGSFKKDSRWARSAWRIGLPASGVATPDVGLRPVRGVDAARESGG
jgi:serine/threonine protein kinase/formylglycine-generating enzyme required for sulfatase activity